MAVRHVQCGPFGPLAPTHRGGAGAFTPQYRAKMLRHWTGLLEREGLVVPAGYTLHGVMTARAAPSSLGGFIERGMAFCHP